MRLMSVRLSVSLRKLHRHCEDSAGSSVPLVFARSSFHPRWAGRQASSVGIHWMTWVERREGAQPFMVTICTWGTVV